ncbi:telomere attrition and p53 response 1 protein [Schistocerca nitens]|uniref:telomere attrition and p53 response 1 protein n=1 Tax=Schistocerca nitens TaxID=7011 RepID=UPI00211872EB|nr:telomere attrition and p53 response 1 protein [Schistocerca nitens]
MNEDRDREDDPLLDMFITNWEEQCIQHVESEPDYEGQLQREREQTHQKLWVTFQNSATAIAQLYRERQQGLSLWIPFQTAAGTVTNLYKDSTEGIRRTSELGIQCGYQRRNKELLSWVRKMRHKIRREDLLSYLAGKPAPPRPHHRSSPRPRTLIERHGSPAGFQMDAQHHEFHISSNHCNSVYSDDNMRTFREAITFANPATAASRRQRSSDLGSFITNEFARHKRPAPSSSPLSDISMDSPTHKRSRLT